MSEKEKEQWIDQKPVKWTITIVLIAGIITISYDLFLSPDAPEGVDTPAMSTGELFAKTLLPEIIKNNSMDNPDIEYVERTLIPQTLDEMIQFIKEHPNMTDEEIDILISYAVGKERGMVDEKIDDKVDEIVMEYLGANP